MQIGITLFAKAVGWIQNRPAMSIRCKSKSREGDPTEGMGSVRFVGLSRLIILAGAIPAVAQNHATIGRSGDPTSKQTQQLPRSCLVQENSSEQIKVLLETINDHPTADAYNALGDLYARGRHTECAISAFKAALRLDGQNWQSHYNLGLALLTKGDRIRAASELQAAIRQQPDSAASHFALATLLQEQGRLDRAETEFENVPQI